MLITVVTAAAAAVVIANLGVGIDVKLAVALYVRLLLIPAEAQTEVPAEVKPQSVRRSRHRQEHCRGNRTGEDFLQSVSSHSVFVIC